MASNLVYYSQKDKRWSSLPYTVTGSKKQTIGTSACGPASFAMAASCFLGRAILPSEAARFALDKGYRTRSKGTAWGFFAAASKHYQLGCIQTRSLETVQKALSAGALVIATMGPGHLTAVGHFVLMVGISGIWADVFDPNHNNKNYGNDGLIKQGVKKDGKISVQLSVFQREARQFWIITKEDNELQRP
ncbi:C39 family peptidase [Paenibacillus glycanilyticus]|uniref:C39 family peptidase n=1 Tax=Paenibacillus glycanilyticus TaxID=126569 RepID=UPI00203BA1B0|nr:C39 family peptidase [Paenibacillus glycanilyticus]MCM3628596.1 C39 family peptidase [Paenibacillus glycanilyticus]